MSEATEKTIIVCGTCGHDELRTDHPDLESLELVPHVVGHATEWNCPRCEQVVYVVYDFGEMEFGI